ALERFWKAQFQGPLLPSDSFAALVARGERLPNRPGGLDLALLNAWPSDATLIPAMLDEAARLLAPDAPLLMAGEGSESLHVAALTKAGFTRQGERRFSSQVIGFDRRPILLYRRTDTA